MVLEWVQAYSTMGGDELCGRFPGSIAQTLYNQTNQQFGESPLLFLDLGSGTGKNTAALVGFGASHVDLFDFLPPDSENISLLPPDSYTFTQGDITAMQFGQEVYHGALLSNIIHYLSPEQLANLFERVNDGLAPEGYIAIRYPEEGRMFGDRRLAVDKFHHPLGSVISQLQQAGFHPISVLERGKPGPNQLGESLYQGYDIIAQKLPLTA
ncbi:MAG: class I SAM-dependent methyltransferase [Candidatus Levyibacteriota bacterium]